MKKRISLLICCSLLAATTAFTTALPSSAAEVTDEISETANVLQTSGETKTYKGFEYRIITSELNEVYNSHYDNWSAKVGDIEIIGYNGTGDTVTIPDTIDGKKVTVLVSGWFPNCGVKSITVPNGIKIIVDSFANENGELLAYSTTLSSKLTEINIPGSVTNIYNTSFNSPNLTSINIDSSNKNYSSSDGVLLYKTEPLPPKGGRFVVRLKPPKVH